MDTVTIRPATAADAVAVAAIARAAWGRIYSGYRDILGDELYELWFSDALERKERTVTDTVMQGGMYVSCRGDEVVGFISYIYDKRTELGMIGNNAVSPAHRGLGIGGRQYEFILERLRESGARGVTVMTGLDEGHAAARRAYEKAGFQKGLPSITYYQKL